MVSFGVAESNDFVVWPLIMNVFEPVVGTSSENDELKELVGDGSVKLLVIWKFALVDADTEGPLGERIGPFIVDCAD